MTRAGLRAAKLHEQFFQRLKFQHLQRDELWANVRQTSREVWVWTSVEVTTKIVPVIRLGPRTLAMAYAVVHELRQRMQAGHPLPVFSTDGLLSDQRWLNSTYLMSHKLRAAGFYFTQLDG